MKKIIVAALLTVSVLTSVIVFTGCKSYEIAYGKYEYYGIRLTNTETGEVTEESKEETKETLTMPVSVEFREDGSCTVNFNDFEILELTYKVNGKGEVNFKGEKADEFGIKEYDSPHGFFENGKFYYIWAYNFDTHIERSSICVLAKQDETDNG